MDPGMESVPRLRIIVICTGNSCRSQIAEGWFKHLAQDDILVVSAGSDPTGYVHPIAIEVMREVGIDLSENLSKPISQFLTQEFEFVITVCDEAAETCPVFPGPGERIHWSLEDPAKFKGTDDEMLGVFRTTRDLIRQRIEDFLQSNAHIDS
jgi:arsenate reductase